MTQTIKEEKGEFYDCLQHGITNRKCCDLAEQCGVYLTKTPL